MNPWPLCHEQASHAPCQRIDALEQEVARLQESLRRADQRAMTLVHEMRSRVGHTLAVLRFMTCRTMDFGGSLEELTTHLEGRLGAIARSQSQLLDDAWGGVELHELIAEEMVAHAAHENEKLELFGPSVRLCSRTAGTITLAIHELAVNAVKFGALSCATGRIRVEWSTEHGRGADGILRDVLRLLWRETGVPVVHAPLRKGFGVELIERLLPGDIGAATSLALGSDGMQCTIVLPMSREVALMPPSPDAEDH